MIIIGSGITGSNVCLELLRLGHQIELWDIGNEENIKYDYSNNFLDTKKNLDLSLKTLIGEKNNNFPSPKDQKLFDIPLIRNYLLTNNDLKKEIDNIDKFNIYQSNNRGGLANGWGANSLPYSYSDVENLNIDYSKFKISQEKIFQEMNVSYVNDNINNQFDIPNLGNQNPIELDSRDSYLMGKYFQNDKFFFKEQFHLGKARLAIENSNNSKSCKLLSNCLWGCSQQAIYNPVHHTLKKCNNFQTFRYFPNRKILYFKISENKIEEIIYIENNEKKVKKIKEKVFLCAGAIQSGIIFNKSCINNNINLDKITTGLMDTKTVKIVYLIPKLIKHTLNYKSIQFNRLIGGLTEKFMGKSQYIHSEFLHLNSLFYQPVINSIPLPLRLAKNLFYNLYAGLGVCTYYLPDIIDNSNKISAYEKKDKFKINYKFNEEINILDRKIEKRIKKYLFKLSAIPLKTIRYDFGSGIHYAGTIPMGQGDSYPVSKFGEVKFMRGLYICDASILPFLPSKPISANAASIGNYIAKNI
tara:strand:- start:2126 stop:3706 length:1581 start_codon:yes stop_codon:yes gene_type:complete